MERNEEQNGRVQMEFLDRSVPQELTAEITLPDYRSEISRLLWVRPTFLPPLRFVGGGKADFSGACRYDILYTGPDGALYSATEDGGFAFSVPLELPSGFDSTGGIELSAEPTADAVISRVTGPRKLSVRCRMHARVCGYGEKEMGVRLKGESSEERERILRLCTPVESGRVMTGGNETVELSEVVENEGDDLRLVATHGEVFLPEVSAASGAVRCRGEAVISLLYCKEGEGSVPHTVVRRIPFEKEIPLEGVTPDCRGRVTGAVGEIRAGVEEGKTLLDVRVSLAAEAQTKEYFALCNDLFLPGKAAEPSYTEERLWRAGLCGNRNFSMSGEVSPTERGVPADAAVVLAMADADVKEQSSADGRVTLSGDIGCHVLYCHAGEYGVCEITLPWRTVIEGCGDDMLLSVTVPIVRVTPVRDMWRVDAEIQLSARGICRHSARVLSEVEFLPAAPVARADLEICYPAAGETLWEVGKRYGISPDDLAAANGLSGEDPNGAASLAGVKYLLIP